MSESLILNQKENTNYKYWVSLGFSFDDLPANLPQIMELEKFFGKTLKYTTFKTRDLTVAKKVGNVALKIWRKHNPTKNIADCKIQISAQPRCEICGIDLQFRQINCNYCGKPASRLTQKIQIPHLDVKIINTPQAEFEKATQILQSCGGNLLKLQSIDIECLLHNNLIEIEYNMKSPCYYSPSFIGIEILKTVKIMV